LGSACYSVLSSLKIGVAACRKVSALRHVPAGVSGFGGLGVCMLASDTQDRGFAPDRNRRIFPVGKIHSMPSFGGEVK
jgi:hypothetical protein